MNKILLNGLHYESYGAGISKYTHMLLNTFIQENYSVDILIRYEFKEICGDSALYCNQYDIQNISDNMLKLISDEELKSHLKLNGKQRLKIFNSNRTAKETYDIYLGAAPNLLKCLE